MVLNERREISNPISKANIGIIVACVCFPRLHYNNKEKKSSNFSNPPFSLKIEQIKVAAYGKLHIREFTPPPTAFFPFCHMWQVSHAAFFQDYISVCLIISFQVYTIKDCVTFLLLRREQREECPPKYSFSWLWHAHLSTRQHSNFLDIFCFNETRDLQMHRVLSWHISDPLST